MSLNIKFLSNPVIFYSLNKFNKYDLYIPSAFLTFIIKQSTHLDWENINIWTLSWSNVHIYYYTKAQQETCYINSI